MSVIAAIAAMQVAGGLDYMVFLAEKVLRSNPKYITFLAPVVTYTMTVFAGTGLTAFSTLPVIAEIAKEKGCPPVATAGHCHGGLPDCHHGIAHFGGGDLLCQ
jgi:anaerobic C4-dicarboxylate transporter DcuA